MKEAIGSEFASGLFSHVQRNGGRSQSEAESMSAGFCAGAVQDVPEL